MQRLQRRDQFQAVLAGLTVARTPHFALHQVALDAPQAAGLFDRPDAWLGAMVPKRWARRAVTRNAIRRQIYAVGQTFESALPQAAHLVRLRAGFDRARFVSASSDALKAAVRSELLQLFGKLPAHGPKAQEAA